MRLLLSAYACVPNSGSEPGIGWNVAREAAKHHEVWVITDTRRRPSIEKEIGENPIPGLHFIYYGLPFWPENKRLGIPGYAYYHLWQIGAYFVASRLHRELRFDLAHHITYGKYWGPSFVSLLPVPFLWGPVGGGESSPRDFLKGFGPRGILYEGFRNLARWIGEHDPFSRLTARRSALALGTTPETAQRLRAMGARNVQVLSAMGLPEEELERPGSTRNDGDALRLISIGRLLHWKGFHLGLQAFAQANLPDAQYWIIGEGPDRARLESLARDLGVQDRVRFWGLLPREETLARLGESHVLLHPSLHDSGGWVCSEAMAAGKPVLCLDLGGPAMQVVEGTGVKVPADSESQTIRDLARAMRLLDENRDLTARMGRAAREHVLREYSWSMRGEKINAFYVNLGSEGETTLAKAVETTTDNG